MHANILVSNVLNKSYQLVTDVVLQWYSTPSALLILCFFFFLFWIEIDFSVELFILLKHEA